MATTTTVVKGSLGEKLMLGETIAVIDGVVAAYPLDEVEGDVVYDRSGNGNHGTATGTTITDGPHAGKKCRYFSGSDVITVPHHASLLCEKELTVLIRIKPSINSLRSIMAKNGWNGQFYLRQNFGYGLYAISSYTGGGGDYLEQSNVNWYSVNAFALVGYTIDLNNNVQKLWVNGVEKYSDATASDKTLVQDTGNITIGAGPEADFNGYFGYAVYTVTVSTNDTFTAAEFTGTLKKAVLIRNDTGAEVTVSVAGNVITVAQAGVTNQECTLFVYGVRA